MRLTTLCYIARDGCYLMLHRNKKAHDENAGVWIGVGGHLEKDESPDDCIAREVREETGLMLTNARLRGVITFIMADWGNEMTFVYTGEAEGEPPATCTEGDLAWVPREQVLSLPLWAGDRVFLPLLQTPKGDCFSLKLVYAAGGALTACILNGNDITKEALGENA